jgi:pimeloyl-ACP methyl ester carboxylesterase
MSDLTLAQLRHAYNTALEQLAAESFLFQGIGEQAYIDALRRGNNPGANPAADDLPGKLRMTLEQAQTFESRYVIIDAYQNDATGFSAVALRDTANPGRVVLAVRSTEILNDRAHDLSADFQVFTSGFAFDQVLSAQDFLNQVRPHLQSGEKIDLVGYSLSGNVVRTLAAMYPAEVNQTPGANVVFNATGLGGFTDPTGQNRPRSVVLQEMMDLYRQVETDPNSATDVPVFLLPLRLAAIVASPIDRTDPNGNLYSSPRQDFAEAYIQNRYGTFYNDFGTIVTEPSFTQYFGVALSGFDANAVANSGSHPVPIGIAIEGQPVVEIPGVASRFDYLNTHSLTLLADSLRLQILFKEIDPNISTDAITAIFQASSASSANTLMQIAEGDTFEQTLNSLRTLFLGPTLDPQMLPSSDAPGAFGNIPNRAAFYNAIGAVKAALGGQSYQIVSLVDMSIETLKGNALLPGDMGTAYRYALKNLNPFAVIGADYTQFHNPGDLDLYEPATGNGSITLEHF